MCFFRRAEKTSRSGDFLSDMQEKFHRMLKLFYWMRRLLFGKGG